MALAFSSGQARSAAFITSSAGSGPCANRLAASATQEIHPIIALCDGVTGRAAEGSARSTIATIGTQRIFGGHVHSQMEKLIAPERCWSRMTPQGRSGGSIRTVTNVESLQQITGVTPVSESKSVHCGYAGKPELDYATPDLSVGRLLRPAGRRILKILLPPIGRHVEQRAGIRQRLGAARVGRIGVEDLVADAEESA